MYEHMRNEKKTADPITWTKNIMNTTYRTKRQLP